MYKEEFMSCQIGKTTVIRRTAVRETGVSRYNEGTLLNHIEHHSAMVPSGLRGALKWVPMMTSDANLSMTANEKFPIRNSCSEIINE